MAVKTLTSLTTTNDWTKKKQKDSKHAKIGKQ